MSKLELTQLIEAGAHFGHLTRRWNPKMRQYIFMEKNGIHIIDLKKTQRLIQNAADKMREIASDGGTVLFVGTKKQAKGAIAQEAKRCGMNWVSERWLGGMLTNFSTIRKSISRMQKIEKMESDGTFEKITKKEQLFRTREKDKLRKILDGVETMKKMPNAIFIVDIKKESIAINEALRLNIPIFAIVDTNCDPDPVDYIIPSNDDAARTIELITKYVTDAIIEGNQKYNQVKAEKAAEKEKLKKQEKEKSSDKKSGKPKIRRVKFNEKGEQKDISGKEKAKKVEAPKKIDEYLAPKEYVGEPGFHKFEKDGKHYFSFNNQDKKVLLRSEGYSSESSMLKGIESVKKNAVEAKRWSEYKAENGKFYFTLKAGNGQEIARSCDYEKNEEMKKDFEWLKSSESKLAEVIEEKKETE